MYDLVSDKRIVYGQEFSENIHHQVNMHEYNSSCYIQETCSLNVSQLTADLVEQIKNNLNHFGFSVISISNHDPIDAIIKWQESFLGNVMPYVGAKITDNKDTKSIILESKPDGKYYVDSHYAQPLHTDGGNTPTYPKYISLYFEEQAEIGGDSIVVNFEPLYKIIIAQFPQTYKKLFFPSAVIYESYHKIVTKPIFINMPDGSVGVTYTPVFKNIICEDDVFEIYKYITNYIHDPKNQKRFKLKKNQMIIIDNTKVFHARTRFSEGGNRKVHRLWYYELSNAIENL